MKAEINNKNKAKFFALYLYQKVLCDNLRKNEILDNSWNWEHESFWLSLKPLSSISDEDAEEVSKINDDFSETFDVNQYKKLFLNGNSDKFPYNLIDHLRSCGYALPWMGLSVEEMVTAGWIKLV